MPQASTLLTFICFILLMTQDSWAQSSPKPGNGSNKPTVYWPDDIPFDTGIPTPKQHFGFDIGHRHLDHAMVAGYIRRLAEVSDRITVDQYATTHGGRPLLLATVTSPQNRQRIKKIQSIHRNLTKPGASKIDIANLPAVINMGYGVHGDESSATNCAPLVVYYLAAAKGEQIDKILKDCIILLDPSLNPDGFNRFANWANRYRGRVLNPDPQHAEHNQQWPPGRVNYYWFDLNRDWLPLVHPESRGRMRWYHKWKPNVVLDFHEMGTNSTFFFQPGIPLRTNPLTPARNQELTQMFGKFHAEALDQRGSLYFTKERFDDFYMGKGSTYPDLHGSVGILFEQASSRGHIQKNQDGILRFHDTIANHFSASLSSLKATSTYKMELLQFKRDFYSQALKMGESNQTQSYLFHCPGNRTRLIKFAATLRRHDIDCYWLKEDLNYGDQTFFAKDTLLVPAHQSEFRFFQSLLARQTDFKENVFYDVSSWTLPLAYGLEQTELKRSLDSQILEKFRFSESGLKTEFQPVEQDLAYLIDWRDDSANWLTAQLLKAGVITRVARKKFTVQLPNGNRKSFGFGTIAVVLGVQKKRTDQILKILKRGADRGAKITPIQTGLSLEGPDLGSSNFSVLKVPKIAMLTGRGTSAYSTGEVWHLLDTQVGLPVTMLKSTSFSSARLDDYTTLVLAGATLDSATFAKIKDFAARGGTVIAIGRTAVQVQQKLVGPAPTKTAAKETEDTPKQKPFYSASKESALKLISGAIFESKIDTTHPIGYGVPNDLPVFRNHNTFLIPSQNPYANPVIYSQLPLLAGYCSRENVKRFSQSASVVIDSEKRGRFILMADNPNFRGFWKGTNRLFLNAIYFGNFVNGR
ncbi:MAG: M14 family metallopeptidase [Planctomycetota bacterium]